MQFETLLSKAIRFGWLLMAVLIFSAALLRAQAPPGVTLRMRSKGGFGAPAMFTGEKRGFSLSQFGPLLYQLHLSPAQMRQIGEIIFNAQKSLIRTRADLAIAGLDLRHTMMAAQPDQAAALQKAQQLGTLRTQLMTIRLKALLAGEAVLTPAQRQQARRLFARRRMMMRVRVMRRRFAGRGFAGGMRGCGPMMRGGRNLFWHFRRRLPAPRTTPAPPAAPAQPGAAPQP